MSRTPKLCLVALALAAACTKSSTDPQGAAPAGQATGQPAAPGKPTPVAGAKRPEPRATDLPAPPDVAAPPADAAKTRSGLASKLLSAGTGKEHPTAEDSVTCHYTGWTTDGKMFDSSVRHGGKPITFPLKGVIPGWTEGVPLMVEGEKRRFWIPRELAYNDEPGAPQGMLVFDIELVKINRPIPAPADVKAPPRDAEKTKTGLASKVLTEGTGSAHPGATSNVEVHYTGWTTDGKMFDSSVMRGEPARFPLNRVIPGWTEGVQLMVEGEKRRFWIPKELAYNDRAGKPAGMLVFDVELLKILSP